MKLDFSGACEVSVIVEKERHKLSSGATADSLGTEWSSKLEG